MRTLPTLLALLTLGCARGPSAEQTLPALRAALDRQVDSDVQNRENSALAEQVSEGRVLHGLTRTELEQRLGPGEPCSRHPICGERGFADTDRYFEVGRAGPAYIRYRPALIVGFSRFGKVERTFVLRVE